MMTVAQIIETGVASSFQDTGRLGLRRFGVAGAGVMDSEAAMYANRLVGNFANEVLLEIGVGGLVLKFEKDTVIAVCGAGEINKTLFLKSGETYRMPYFADGMWAYVAIHGGWCVKKIMGSASFHERSGLGQAIEKGSVLTTDGLSSDFQNRSIAKYHILSLNYSDPIRVTKGPHADKLSFDDFISMDWQISTLIDRTGYRLKGALKAHELRLKSFPTLPGCIQITPAGEPIVTLNDGPTVGGYPVVAIIHPEDLAKFVQHRPLQSIKFTSYDID